MSVHGSTPSRALRATDGQRRRAFIPDPGDESHELDTLGFFAWGAFRGEWSGTSTWLADAPLPEGVPDSMVRDLPAVSLIDTARERLTEDAGQPVVLLAPVINAYGFAVLPIDGSVYDVNPNYVAHIERVVPGGRWLLFDDVAKFVQGGGHPALVYVVDGDARGMVALIRPDEAQR